MPQRTFTSRLKLFIKKILTRFFQFIFLNRAVDVTDSLPQGTLLVIAPHPDDETLGCAAIMRHYKLKGHIVRIVVVTDGSQAKLPGDPSPQDIATMRRKESVDAAKALDISMEDVLFLSYADGSTEENKDRIAHDITSQIWLYQPALVLSPHGLDAHKDHRAIADVVRKLQKDGKITCPLFEYPMWFWPKGALHHFVSPALQKTHRKVRAKEFLPEKKQAIAAHVCQKSEENWDLLEAYAIADNLHDSELFFAWPPEKA